jgi:hypothetical protein
LLGFLICLQSNTESADQRWPQNRHFVWTNALFYPPVLQPTLW